MLSPNTECERSDMRLKWLSSYENPTWGSDAPQPASSGVWVRPCDPRSLAECFQPLLWNLASFLSYLGSGEKSPLPLPYALAVARLLTDEFDDGRNAAVDTLTKLGKLIPIPKPILKPTHDAKPNDKS